MSIFLLFVSAGILFEGILKNNFGPLFLKILINVHNEQECRVFP